MDKNGIIKTDIWYREKSKNAYPAKKNDDSFPIFNFLFLHIKLPLIWIILLLINTRCAL